MKLQKYLDNNNYDINDIEIEFENIVLMDGEIFKDLISPLYPEIKPIYKISNKNRIYSTETKKFLSVKVKKHGNGYYQVSLQTYYPDIKLSVSKNYSMHRLMMSVFCPVENMDKLYINHKDGRKTNNELDNLEWCTCSENVLHAIKIGLYIPKRGELSSGSKITENDVKKICELLTKRDYSYKQIAEIVGNGVTISMINSISTRTSWKDISKDYIFDKTLIRAPKYFTIDEANMYCKYFQSNTIPKDISVRRYLINMIKILTPDKNITTSLIDAVRKLYDKKGYYNITKQYKY